MIRTLSRWWSAFRVTSVALVGLAVTVLYGAVIYAGEVLALDRVVVHLAGYLAAVAVQFLALNFIVYRAEGAGTRQTAMRGGRYAVLVATVAILSSLIRAVVSFNPIVDALLMIGVISGLNLVAYRLFVFRDVLDREVDE